MENTSNIVDPISDPVLEVIDVAKNTIEDIKEDINNENININNNILSDIQNAQNSLNSNLKVVFDTSGIQKTFDSILSVITSQQTELSNLNSQVFKLKKNQDKLILDKEISEKEAKESKELLNNTIEKQELTNKNVEEINENLKVISNNIKELTSTYQADKLTAALNIPEIKSDNPDEDKKPSVGSEMISNLIRGLDDQRTELEAVQKNIKKLEVGSGEIILEVNKCITEIERVEKALFDSNSSSDKEFPIVNPIIHQSLPTDLLHKLKCIDQNAIDVSNLFEKMTEREKEHNEVTIKIDAVNTKIVSMELYERQLAAMENQLEEAIKLANETQKSCNEALTQALLNSTNFTELSDEIKKVHIHHLPVVEEVVIQKPVIEEPGIKNSNELYNILSNDLKLEIMREVSKLNIDINSAVSAAVKPIHTDISHFKTNNANTNRSIDEILIELSILKNTTNNQFSTILSNTKAIEAFNKSKLAPGMKEILLLTPSEVELETRRRKISTPHITPIRTRPNTANNTGLGAVTPGQSRPNTSRIKSSRLDPDQVIEQEEVSSPEKKEEKKESEILLVASQEHKEVEENFPTLHHIHPVENYYNPIKNGDVVPRNSESKKDFKIIFDETLNRSTRKKLGKLLFPDSVSQNRRSKIALELRLRGQYIFKEKGQAILREQKAKNLERDMKRLKSDNTIMKNKLWELSLAKSPALENAEKLEKDIIELNVNVVNNYNEFVKVLHQKQEIIDNLQKFCHDTNLQVIEQHEIIASVPSMIKSSFPPKFQHTFTAIQSLTDLITENGGLQRIFDALESQSQLTPEMINILNDINSGKPPPYLIEILAEIQRDILYLDDKSSKKLEILKMLDFTSDGVSSSHPLAMKLFQLITDIVNKSTDSIRAKDKEVHIDEVNRIAQIAAIYTDERIDFTKKKLGDGTKALVESLKETIDNNARREAGKYNKLSSDFVKLNASIEVYENNHNKKNMELDEEFLVIKNKLKGFVEDMNLLHHHTDNALAAVQLIANDSEAQNKQIAASKKAQENFLPELQELSKAYGRLSDRQSYQANKLVNDITNLKLEVSGKTSEAQTADIVNLLQNTFKKQIGENTDGLQIFAKQIIKMVDRKATKDEVMHLVTTKMNSVNDSLNSNYNNSNSITLKCLSCGHGGTPTKRRIPDDDDDDMSIVSSLSNEDDASIRSIVSRQAGLKPLLHRTVTPSQAQALAKSKSYQQKRNNNASINPKYPPEPLYRKAKLAAHVKELVKIPISNSKFSNSSPQSLVVFDVDDASQFSSPISRLDSRINNNEAINDDINVNGFDHVSVRTI